MASGLPIGIENLLQGAVEDSRLELKATWDPGTTGSQVLKTLAAFANDLQNLNGGYVVIGAQEQNGVVQRPVVGLSPELLDDAQRWIRGNCHRIVPEYMPVFFIETVDQQKVLVCWASASESRPHQAPDGPAGQKHYWVRIGSETVVAKGEILQNLIQQAARVPFDDRRAFDAVVEDLSITLVREFLHNVQSELVHEPDSQRVYTNMQLVRPQNGHYVPRNVALLFFSEDPRRWFRGAQIDIVEFQDDAGGDTLREQELVGPLPHQVRQALNVLENRIRQNITKGNRSPDASVSFNYPMAALREAVVNAIYHRGYDNSVESVEPTKIYLYPNRIEIMSYPGPVHGIEQEHLQSGASAPSVPARNRRIGEFLKELQFAEKRGTGLPKIRRAMRENGSPEPTFDFDTNRTYFRVTLPVHLEHMGSPLVPINAPKLSSERIFVSYAGSDREFVNDLLVHLAPLQRQGQLTIWNDAQIAVGKSWADSIQQAMDECTVAVLVVSPAYLASQYVHDIEMPHLLARAEKGQVILAPIFAMPSAVEIAPFTFSDATGTEQRTLLTNYQGFRLTGNSPYRTLMEIRQNSPVEYQRTLANIATAIAGMGR